MGRELRRVPLGYEHPTAAEALATAKACPLAAERDDWERKPYGAPDGQQAMFDREYAPELAEWERARTRWERGEHPDQLPGGLAHDSPHDRSETSWEDWHGGAPDPRFYRHESWEGRELGIQLWESTSEGTPLSPVFPDTDDGLRALATWAEENATTFANFTASAEGWYEMLRDNRVSARSGGVVFL